MFTRSATNAEAMLIEGEAAADDAQAGSAEAAEPSEEPSSRPAPCILLVEDDFLVGMEMEMGLEEAGYAVVIATTAEEAAALAEKHRPALAVMDIRLAGERDGVDAALEIFRRFEIRSLFASAHGDSHFRARAEAARPLGWIAKPYRVGTLLRAVEEALREV
jgi:two-component system, response regulator PdtaR